ncbi:proliferating cell nuclear antigen (pcna) [Candidatus Woesearchaeota archaeon]|nr:MAG: proliferating cell nuclear antigen (pcna) [Candidatus Woesearchaeota archaeon]
MKLTLAEPKYLKDSINAISELINEARFKITKDAIELIAMDPANVAMVVFKLLSSAFVEYELEEEVEIATNFADLKQVMKRAKSNDMLTLALEENRLKITLKGNSTRTFMLATIELDEKEQKVPNLTFPVSVKTSTQVLGDAIDDADVFADSVTFIVENGKFIIEAEANTNRVRNEISEGAEINAETQDKVSAKYSIEYLKKMMTGAKLSDDVVIKFNKDYPLMLEFKTVDKVMLSFILAPRVEND